jgi:tetratricopeptide (TPR) repeat protein
LAAIEWQKNLLLTDRTVDAMLVHCWSCAVYTCDFYWRSINHLTALSFGEIKEVGLMSSDDEIQADYETALEFMAEGDIESARPCLRRMMKKAPNDLRTVELSGDFARFRGEYDKADQLYRQLVTLSDDLDVLAISLMNRGTNYEAQGKRAEATDMYTQAIAAYQQIGDTEGLVSVYSQLGILQMESGQLKSAAESFSEALKVIESPAKSVSLLDRIISDDGDDDLETERMYNEFTRANLERELGQVHRMLGNLDTSVDFFNSAIDRYRLLEDEVEVAQTLDCLGVVRQVQGNFDEAEALHQQAIEINKEFENQEGLSVNYGNLAILHRHLKDYDRVEHYINKAHKIDKAQGRADAIADYHIKLGEVKYERGDYMAAESNLLKALQQHKKLDDIAGIAVAQSHLGVLYRLKGDYERSETMTLKALAICEEMEHLDFIASVVDELGMLRKMQGRPDEAKELWTRSLGMFERLQSAKMIEETKQALADLESPSGD